MVQEDVELRFNRFAHSAGPGLEPNVGKLVPHLRWKWAPGGLENRRRGVPFSWQGAQTVLCMSPGLQFRMGTGNSWQAKMVDGAGCKEEMA